MLKYYKDLKSMATVHGNVSVENGVVKGLTKEQEKEFANLPGFEYNEDKTTTKKEAPKEEPKKTTTRKTTRKAPTKKEEEK